MSSSGSRAESMASSTASVSSSGSAATPTALPTEEALQILLSPDGYYKYLGIAKPKTEAMGPKYQAAMEAGGAGGTSENGGVDLDQVKKNYRRLSLRHHPDRKTGDAETFRMLNRAKVVLSSSKLRREYDLVGLDLEDDAEEEHHEEGNSTTAASENGEGNSGGEAHQEDGGGKDGGSSKTESVMSHLASATLAGVLQVVVRTGLMGLVSVLVSRYTVLTFLAMGLLTFLTTRMYSTLKKTLGPNAKLSLATMKDVVSPLVIAFGIFCMYRGRRFFITAATTADPGFDNTVAGDATDAAAAQTEIQYAEWSLTFLFGEALVMTSFISNSFDTNRPMALLLLFSVLSLLLSLWLRGRFWRYATILGFEGVVAMLVVMAFPIMEMILESIVEEKMRKVGEKIRAHDIRMKEMLKRKKGQAGGAS